MRPINDADVAHIDAVALAEYRRTECPWERGAIAALNPIVKEREVTMGEQEAERERARQAKAIKLASVLIAASATAADVEMFGPTDWRNAARAAWVRIPSETTQGLVVELLKMHEATTVADDPFEGLS